MTHTCILSNIAEALEFDHFSYGDTVTDPGFGKGGEAALVHLKNM